MKAGKPIVFGAKHAILVATVAMAITIAVALSVS